MIKYLKQSLDFTLFSNIFIAFCAVSQGLTSYWLLETKPDKYVIGILFCSTLTIYNFSILLAKPKKPEDSPFSRTRWIFSHYRLMLTLLIISTLSTLVLAFFLNISSLIFLLILGIISITYSLPIWENQGKKYGIRNIPGLKLFIIGFVWAGSTVLLPIFESKSYASILITNKESIILFLSRFLFIVAITIPFDIRDVFQDKHNELKTIPVIIGEKKSVWLSQLFLFASLVLLFAFTEKMNTNFWAITFSTLISGYLIFMSNRKKNEYYYFLLLDGTMIMQLLLLLLFHITP